MQTIRVPWKASEVDRARIAEWQRHRAVATRTAYANAEGKSFKELRRIAYPIIPWVAGISIVQQWREYLFVKEFQMVPWSSEARTISRGDKKVSFPEKNGKKIDKLVQLKSSVTEPDGEIDIFVYQATLKLVK